ncbi:alpha/beta hydrolase family protein [Alteribacillus sp. JSM 102045]|uniref:alpha/beta hydrolase family protein n=1 Tax=Alteribacillus sp. JSM 102045 TaxID=1562101 RepID=UPI0035C25EA0
MIEKKKLGSINNINLFEVAYKSGKYAVKGCLGVPNETGTLPGILYLRGGLKKVGMVKKEWVAELAHNGYVVFAPYYRGNEGGEGQEDFCGYDREDAMNGFDVLAALEETKGKPLHIVGFSRGAVMALFTGMKKTASAIVCWSGVSDMTLTYKERSDLRKMLRRVTGGDPITRPLEYEWRTPLKQIGDLKAPVFILHGEKDEHVSVEHAHRLEAYLKAAGLPVLKQVYPNMPHHFLPPVRQKAISEMIKWMDGKNHS